MPLGMKGVTILNLAGFAWYFWDLIGTLQNVDTTASGTDKAGLALLLLSLSLFWWTVGINRRRPMTLAFSTDEPVFIQTNGPYAYVRHPFYLAYLLFWVATGLVSRDLEHWALPVIMVLVYAHAAATEEAKFAASPIGAAYKSYRARTAMLLPLLIARSGNVP